jgi:hypothetical protein
MWSIRAEDEPFKWLRAAVVRGRTLPYFLTELELRHTILGRSGRGRQDCDGKNGNELPSGHRVLHSGIDTQ